MIDNKASYVFDRRSALFLGAGAVLTSILIIRMFQMQVFSYSSYTKKSEHNSFRIQIDMPERGKILSASGSPISRDARTYRIYIIPEEAEDIDLLIKILVKGLGLKKKKVDWIYARIKKQARFQPVLISENSDWEKLAQLQAQNLPGLHIKSGYTRIYEFGEAGAQIFGYIGVPDKPVLNTPFFTHGVTGLEKTFDKTLSGKSSQNVTVINALGRTTGEDKSQHVPGEIGQNIRTTINEAAQKKLQDHLTLAKSGCGVVLEIETGKVLAIASAPSFDPNNFKMDDADEYISSLRNNFAKPFMNKSLEGLYPPGSTFKIIVALTALESGAITVTEKVHCPGYWDYGDRRYHCWDKKGHGNMNLAEALKHSCDIYFYQIALRIGIDSIKKMAVRLGFTEKFMGDLLLREMTGIMPDRSWKEKRVGQTWMHGDTIISGIGQGFILANSMQLAVMMARASSNKIVVPKMTEDDKKAVFESLNLHPKSIASVFKGLDGTTQPGGTAAGSAINVKGKRMGGKTGTSQVRSITMEERKSGVLTSEQLKWNMRNHGLFVGYAPTNSPKYAISIITEHSGGSGLAARAAAAVIEELLKNG